MKNNKISNDDYADESLEASDEFYEECWEESYGDEDYLVSRLDPYGPYPKELWTIL